MLRRFFKILDPLHRTLVRTVPQHYSSNGKLLNQSKEEKLSSILKEKIPGITYISIEDISGGCGAMYEVNVEAKEFDGLSRVKQHRLVTESLKEEIAQMHGIRIHTTPTPKQDGK